MDVSDTAFPSSNSNFLHRCVAAGCATPDAWPKVAMDVKADSLKLFDCNVGGWMNLSRPKAPMAWTQL